jgi:uncharacterized membrane protein
MNLIDELLEKIDVKNLRKTILFSSIVIFIISLTQECFCTFEGCADSIIVLVFGFFGILSGGVGLSWFANPLIIASWILIKNNKISTILSIIAFVLSFSFLFFKEIMTDESGNLREILGYKLGYWLWLLSIFITLLGNLTVKIKLKRNNNLSQL